MLSSIPIAPTRIESICCDNCAPGNSAPYQLALLRAFVAGDAVSELCGSCQRSCQNGIRRAWHA